MVRNVAWRLMIDWDRDGNYDDESGALISAQGDMSLGGGAAGGSVDSCTLVLHNGDGRLSPDNAAGVLADHIYGGLGFQVPFYLEVSVNGGSNYYRVFTGVNPE